MKYVSLKGIDQPVSAIVLGMMRICDKTDAEIRDLVAAGLDRGVTMIDHADIYGPEYHESERRFAQAMRWTSSQREKVLIQSKCAIVREDGPYLDFSEARIRYAVEGSLKALDTDYLDVLLLHRPDALMEPEEVAAAFTALEAEGKVRHFGVSNHTIGQIKLLRQAVTQPLVANQLQLSLTHAPMIAQGLAMNMQEVPQAVDRGSSVLDYCQLEGITVQAWSPLQAGFFTGTFLGDREQYRELNEALDDIAAEYGVDPIAIATAWITRHPAGIQFVTGTTNPKRVAASCEGSDIVLTRAQWYRLYRAAGYLIP
ncbi:MAG: aldo/keto reductase [Micrococcales bacterium]|nr:aldo/keto reductase [Micrococcales bacterium]